MFDHLCDPDAPELGSTFRQRVVTKANARQRRTRLAVGGVALAPLLALGGIAIYIREQASELDRIEVPGLLPADSLPPVESGPTRSDPEPTEIPPIATPLNILIVGIDRRPPGSEVIGSRGDTIAVVRIDPDQGRVGILSLPRDLWITKDLDASARLNSFTDNGALVGVVSSLLRIDINHYIEVDFDGFQSLIDLAGGVTIPFDRAVRDSSTGFSAEAGCNELSGTDALGYVRSRRLEEFDPATGQWTQDPRSDIGRIARQQDLMQRVYIKVLAQDYSTTGQVRLLNDVVDDLTVDTGLDLDGLRAIFNAATIIGTDNFETFDLTTDLTSETIDGNSVLVADPAGIESEVAKLLGRAPTTPDGGTTPTPDSTSTPPTTAC